MLRRGCYLLSRCGLAGSVMTEGGRPRLIPRAVCRAMPQVWTAAGCYCCRRTATHCNHCHQVDVWTASHFERQSEQVHFLQSVVDLAWSMKLRLVSWPDSYFKGTCLTLSAWHSCVSTPPPSLAVFVIKSCPGTTDPPVACVCPVGGVLPPLVTNFVASQVILSGCKLM